MSTRTVRHDSAPSRPVATGEQFLTGIFLQSDAGSLDETPSAFEVAAGIRPIPLLGTEVAYIDFGHPGGAFN